MRTYLLIGACLVAVFAYCVPAKAGEDEQKIKINLAGLDLATVAKQVERVTKKSFLFDENVLRNKRVTLQSDTPISATEFYRVFQSVCQMNGLALVPVEGAGINLEKIVNAQGALKEPGTQPVLIRGDLLPSGDTLVSYLAKLKYASAQRVMPVLTPALSSTGTVLQIANTDLLMISDVSSSIKRAEKILALLDVPGEPVTMQAVPVLHIGVDKAQTFLNEFIQAVTKLKTGEANKDRIVMIKDERLNMLHLIGPDSEVKQARDFLKAVDVDSPAAKRTIRYYKLNNVPVKEIVDYVTQLLGVALSARSTTEKPASDSPAPSFPQAPAAQPHAAPAVPPVQPPVASTTRKSAAPVGRTADKKFDSADIPADIIPVEGLNTLVVAGDPTVHLEVEAILKNLDRRKGQVLIEVAIVQVSGDDSFDLGVEGIKLKGSDDDKYKGDVGTGFGIGTQSDTRERGFPTELALSAISGGAFRFVNADRLQVVISALAGKTNVSIVSQPLLLVNDNEEASFTTKVSQPTTTTSQGTATTNVSFSGFADATTSLQITPHISPDNYINLEITQTFEEFTGAAAGPGIPPPKVSNNAETKISVPDRQTIVIGGFTRDSSSDTRTGVPGLMNVPGLGKLFSRENKRKITSRLYLFVRPKILATENFEDLKAASSKKKEDVEQLTRKSNIKEEIQERLNPRAEVIEEDLDRAGEGNNK